MGWASPLILPEPGLTAAVFTMRWSLALAHGTMPFTWVARTVPWPTRPSTLPCLSIRLHGGPTAGPPRAILFFWEAHMGKKLYVGGLPYGVTDSDLEQMCGAHGTVQSAQV